MSFLARPAWLSASAVLLALAVHPLARLERWPAARVAVPALALLLALSLFARALSGGLSDRVVALGALAALAGIGYDVLRGHGGLLTLAVGQGARSFEEDGPGGRRLGYRPLGFDLRLERADASGEAVLGVGPDDGEQNRITVAPQHAVSYSGWRFGDPQVTTTGAAAVVRLAVSGPSGTQEIDLAPGQTASVAGAAVAVEQYFADFALDQDKKPFSRSVEARNPAALLDVTREGRSFRVFVIQALPGIHRQEGLDLSFALLGVQPERSVRIRVSQSKAASLVAAGLALAALGLALRLREAP